MKDFVNPTDPWLYAAVIFGFIFGVASSASPLGGIVMGALFAGLLILWNFLVDLLFGKLDKDNDKDNK